uniref:Fibronectin type-III domain-containing protein n=1 Tax=Neogobius melanostomus TaxID=47308 RepID=A0A8C6WN83_9GOBI
MLFSSQTPPSLLVLLLILFSGLIWLPAARCVSEERWRRLTPLSMNYSVKTLFPGSSYVFVLSAKSRAGYGAVSKQEITIPMCPPSGHPKISDFVNATCCSLHLSWQPPVPEDCNGAIIEYTIAYKKAVSQKDPVVPSASSGLVPSAPPWLVTIPATESSYIIVGLNHSTAYMVQIRAHNKAGPGPFSSPRLCQTLAFETGRAV